MDLLRELLSCCFTNASVADAMNINVFRMLNSTIEMNNCLDNETLTGWQHGRCFLHTHQLFQAKGIVFATAIRFRMAWTMKSTLFLTAVECSTPDMQDPLHV